MAKELKGKTIVTPDHVVEAQPDEDAGFFTSQPKRLSRKRLVVIALACLVGLGVVVGLGIWLAGNRTAAVTGCTVQQLQAAKKAIGAKDITTLSKVSADIQKNSQYRQDMNCLYVVAASDVYQGGYDKAIVSYNAFYSKYDERVSLSRAVSDNARVDVQAMANKMTELRTKNDQIRTDREDLL